MPLTLWQKISGDFLGPSWPLGWWAAGLAALSVLLALFLWTRWGQTRPLQKCFLLSMMLHLLLALGATTVKIVVPDHHRAAPAPTVEVTLVDEKTPAFNEAAQPGATLGDLGSVLTSLLPLKGDAPIDPGFQDTPAAAPVASPPSPLFTQLLTQVTGPVNTERSLPVDLPSDAGPRQTDGPTNPYETGLAELPLSEPIVQESAEPAPEADIKTKDNADRPSASERGLTALLASSEDIRSDSQPTARQELEHVFQQIRQRISRDDNREASPGTTRPPLEDLVAIAADAGPVRETLDTPEPLPEAAAEQQPISPSELAWKPSRFPFASVETADYQSPQVALKPESELSVPRPHLRPRGPLLTDLPGQTPASQASELSVRWRDLPAGTSHQVPEIFRLRIAPNRRIIAEKRGATPATDLAVEKGLRWLSRNQDPDGRWNPRRHSAGVERYVAGRDRQGAGKDADTALTGLAILAFLGAGYTHEAGPYQETVRRGLDFLVRSQSSDGNLAGQAQYFSAMYCHAIALLALSEAYALTGSAELREPIARAALFTIRAQDPVGGGWRYRPGDPGDTSQLGWQILALKSAEAAGLEIPSIVYQRAEQFLASVSSGHAGGLAAYRSVEPPSAPMTAEALVCRLFLRQSLPKATVHEAVAFIVRDLPGSGHPNFYFWYYATLGLSQIGGPEWERWNRALRDNLLSTQRQDYPWEGSWDPICIWGGYGGRVYTTALGILCLETYYRYLPMLQSVGLDPPRTAGARPAEAREVTR